MNSPSMGNRQFGKLTAYLSQVKYADGSRKYSPAEVRSMTGNDSGRPRNYIFAGVRGGMKHG